VTWRTITIPMKTVIVLALHGGIVIAPSQAATNLPLLPPNLQYDFQMVFGGNSCAAIPNR